MDEIQEENKRPTGLLILFILTLINSVYNIFQNIATLFIGKSEEVLISQKKMILKSMSWAKEYDPKGFKEEIDTAFVLLDAVYENFIFYHLLSLLFYGLGILGAIFMFKGMKIGFHIYIVYSFLVLIQNYFILEPSQIPISGLLSSGLISLLFIYLYSRHLKWMKINEFGKVD